MIGVIDMAMGNLRSVVNAVDTLGNDVRVVSQPADIQECSHLIIPGVGAYATAMQHLHERKFVEPIRSFAGSGKPLLGICLGMHILSERGSEGGETAGLALVPGGVDMMDRARVPSIPHIGWNTVTFVRTHPVLTKVKNALDFYFVHSYEFRPADAGDRLTETEFGEVFASSVARKNVVGFQFHPEKSQSNGLKLLDNFCSWNGQC